MSARRTPEQLIAHREEMNRKARLRLARAKDARIEHVESMLRGLMDPAFNGLWIGDDSQTIADAMNVLERIHAKLVAEATAP